MKKYYFITLLFFIVGTLTAQQIKNVYFIGNSYTSYNNLPQLISQMAQSTNDQLIYQEHSPGGSTFQQHLNNAQVVNTINQATWDYVVLQQQSQMPAFPNATATLNPAAQLCTLIKTANPCTVPMFYMTWGRKNGDAVNCANGITYMCTYEGMDDKLYERYMQMTEDNDATVSPVARVWRYIRENHPTIELYSPDESHPSLEGSMAAAYTFYVAIYKKDPTLVTFNSTLSAATATILKNAVKTVVFNNKENFLIDVNDNFANFNAHLISGNNVQFNNATPNAININWDFGDGSTSTLQNPAHNFATNGTYTVTLTLNACGKIYTKTKQITISTLSNVTFNLSKIKIYPNPTNDYLMISNIEIDALKVFDSSGKFIKTSFSKSENGYKLDVSHLQNGNYILQLSKENGTQSFKFIKK